MASAAVIEQGEMTGDIAVIVAQTPALVLVDSAKRDDLFAHIKREISAFEPDVSTAKGRDAIKSFAFKITRTKTAIDDAGKKLNEDARAKIAVVDAARRDARETLDELAKSVRKPLTDWEVAEKDRNDRADAIIDQLARAAMVGLDETAADVRARGMAVYQLTLDPALFGDKLDTAQKAKGDAVDTLKAALARLTREEADRAELQRLRDEAAARELADKIAAEQAEAERQQALQIEAERAATERAAQEAAEHAQREQERQIAAQQAEAARIEQARLEAAALAEQQAREAAKAEQDKRDREHAEALAEAQAERDRLAEIEAERRAQVEREAAEQARRDKNRAHRAQILGQAKIAIMAAANDGHAIEHPITEAAAIAIVKAIANGFIPNISLRF